MNRDDLRTFLVAGLIALVVVCAAALAHAADPQTPSRLRLPNHPSLCSGARQGQGVGYGFGEWSDVEADQSGPQMPQVIFILATF